MGTKQINNVYSHSDNFVSSEIKKQKQLMDFLTVERDPNKRRVKPVEQACVLDFDEESSDDSDFRIEDHPEVSDDDDSLDSNGDIDNGRKRTIEIDDNKFSVHFQTITVKNRTRNRTYQNWKT